MENVTEIVKKHPLAISAGAVVLLLLLMRGNSDTGTNGMLAASLKSQETAGKTDIALSTINAQTAMARSAVMGDIWKTAITSNAALSKATGDTALQGWIAKINGDENMASISASQDIERRQISASQATAARQMDTALQINKDNLWARLTAAAEALKSDNFRVSSAYELERYKTDVTAANLPQILHSQEVTAANTSANMVTLASINAQTAQAIAALNTEAARKTASANATSSNVQSAGGIVDLFKTVADVFSFI